MKQRRANKNGWKVRQASGKIRSKKPAFNIPPILLEGDEPSIPSPAAPGHAFTLPPPREELHPAPAVQEQEPSTPEVSSGEAPRPPASEPAISVSERPVAQTAQ